MKKLITLTIGIIFTLIPLTEINAQSKVAHITCLANGGDERFDNVVRFEKIKGFSTMRA